MLSLPQLRQSRDECKARMAEENRRYNEIADAWTADQNDPIKYRAWVEQKKVAEDARLKYEAADSVYLEAVRRGNAS